MQQTLVTAELLLNSVQLNRTQSDFFIFSLYKHKNSPETLTDLHCGANSLRMGLAQTYTPSLCSGLWSLGHNQTM